MPRIGNPVRALMRLDDRVLGPRLYYRPLPPLRVDVARTVADPADSTLHPGDLAARWVVGQGGQVVGRDAATLSTPWTPHTPGRTRLIVA
ncbi:hypothetical protein Airi02_092630 [Actinoallomurus iriomotensis]|uniref:Uncharacterized protein n=1 Tax=Actinoallomurus iriomotensis TaxID=478107 RepID=A0A9W6SD07_9ACTN|nr:hypothetical protein Airi02_092630 [Actinoallomurus iriomotensis]